MKYILIEQPDLCRVFYFRPKRGVSEDGLGREHDAKREGKPPICNTGVLSLVLSAFTILMYLQALARQCLSVASLFKESSSIQYFVYGKQVRRSSTL